ncbi:hypothetical protein [Leucobacter aridicollis]|uniref:Uncharacterized protein n=1 Tax=Leucobacter aridicollis TaxID=283878 RepID=A0A852R1S9_9MICO|nr:hypothetical protein [Leucobacter aridicollis]MBL3683376.1 hypothetical protein [Leucobacter aridicollis]NYD25615.1 hypothetical protein [Leucobacter aridicollis]
MVLLGWAVTIAGLALFFVSMRIVLRSRPNEHIPLAGRPDPMPPHAEWTYTVGLVLTVSSGLLISRDVGPWNFVLLFVGALAAILGFSIHNRRIDCRNAAGPESNGP